MHHLLGVVEYFTGTVGDVSSHFMIVVDNFKDVSSGFAKKEADGRGKRKPEE